MAKEAFAVIAIKVGPGEFIQPGEKLDLSKFTKEDVQRLYDLGALEVREVPDPPKTFGPDTSVQKPESKSVKDEEKPKK